jgi:hypothetical protein
MYLEHVLGKINPDRDNLHLDGSLNVIRNDHPMAHRCRERAPSTTSEAVVPEELCPVAIERT